MMYRKTSLTILFSILVLFLAACGSTAPEAEAIDPSSSSLLNVPIEDGSSYTFKGTLSQDIDGNPIKERNINGVLDVALSFAAVNEFDLASLNFSEFTQDGEPSRVFGTINSEGVIRFNTTTREGDTVTQTLEALGTLQDNGDFTGEFSVENQDGTFEGEFVLENVAQSDLETEADIPLEDGASYAFEGESGDGSGTFTGQLDVVLTDRESDVSDIEPETVVKSLIGSTLTINGQTIDITSGVARSSGSFTFGNRLLDTGGPITLFGANGSVREDGSLRGGFLARSSEGVLTSRNSFYTLTLIE